MYDSAALREVATDNSELLDEALAGLSSVPKTMSPKWFYDELGSALFEEITQLPEYYQTRTETRILEGRVSEVSVMFADTPVLVELGSGASVKTRILLDELPGLTTYAPQDISAEFLAGVVADLNGAYPRLSVRPLIGDFTGALPLPPDLGSQAKLVFFPGSTIGNLDPIQAQRLLVRVAAWQKVDALILGTDLVKDERVLVPAYDDAAGVTARFNKNLLARLNRELGCNFDLNAFEHEARWNTALARIEMHLVSLREQSVRVGTRNIRFAYGESLHTENSYKFTRDSLDALLQSAGWTIEHFWTDPEAKFGVSVARPAG